MCGCKRRIDRCSYLHEGHPFRCYRLPIAGLESPTNTLPAIPSKLLCNTSLHPHPMSLRALLCVYLQGMGCAWVGAEKRSSFLIWCTVCICKEWAVREMVLKRGHRFSFGALLLLAGLDSPTDSLPAIPSIVMQH